MEILIKRLREDAKLPMYSREAGPGIDLYALEPVTIEAGERVKISTGVVFAMPVGYVGFIWNQCAASAVAGLQVVPNLIDSGYRTEVQVELVNAGAAAETIQAGQSIAQVLVQKIEHADLIEAEDLGA